ncbi:MAG: sensor domain-containing diguanylate cyclase [Chlamydiae bacterium]|nr:sensor domain-containing diguanylate cyclase [Chlamydiota bacterium]MBI3266534.1 sensor domain-containing diguanylate cyclase [Chlamydiota bacterium]
MPTPNKINPKLLTRLTTLLLMIGLLALQLFTSCPRHHFPKEWVSFCPILYLSCILLASLGFGVLGTFITSTVSLVLTSFTYFRAHMASPLGWIFVFASFSITLYFYLTRHEKELIQKRITLSNLEAEWNHLSKKYSKDKGVLRSYKNKIHHYHTLRQLGEKLINTLSLDETAKRILEIACQLIGKGDLATLFLLDDNLKTLTLLHEIDLAKEGPSFLIQPADPFNQWILNNRQNLLIEELKSDFRFEENAKKGLTSSLIEAALTTENKLIGALRLESREPHVFQLDDLRMLANLSNVASTSLKNAKLYSETLELSIKDGLTGLHVPTYFHQELQKAFLQAHKNHESLSVLMADIDNFKSINDRYGHTVGDGILKKISEVFHEVLEKNFIPSRYGGEEFSAFFPGWPREKTITLAENLRRKIQTISLEIRREILNVTVSMGISEIKPTDSNKDELIQRADQALYEAKRTGKNKVCYQ